MPLYLVDLSSADSTSPTTELVMCASDSEAPLRTVGAVSGYSSAEVWAGTRLVRRITDAKTWHDRELALHQGGSGA